MDPKHRFKANNELSKQKDTRIQEFNRTKCKSPLFDCSISPPGGSLGLMPSRRRPLNPIFSPRQTMQVSHTSEDSHEGAKKSHWPQKVSHKTYEFSERKVVITKRSTIDVAVLPPKRQRMEDWCPRSRLEERLLSGHGRMSTNRPRSKLEEFKTDKVWVPVTRQTPCSRSNSLMLAHDHSKRKCHDKEDISIPPFTIGKISQPNLSCNHLKMEDLSNCGTKFSWSDWVQNNFSFQQYREILLFSKNVVPVTMIETEDHIFIKFEPKKILDDQSKDREQNVPSLGVILLSPAALVVKLVSGLVKWVAGG